MLSPILGVRKEIEGKYIISNWEILPQNYKSMGLISMQVFLEHVYNSQLPKIEKSRSFHTNSCLTLMLK